ALTNQAARRGHDEEVPLIGEILVEMGFIDRERLDEAVTEQILQLRAKLEENNRELERRVAARTRELQEALNKLEELNQLKSNFVSNISHELRTPLTHIKGYLELLSSGDMGMVTQEQVRALQTMGRASQRLERLIEDLILFSTAEHNQVTLRAFDFNLTRLCESILDHFQRTAVEHKVKLGLEAPRNLPYVRADAEKTMWVIQQLVDNAIKFTPANGQVRIILAPHDQRVRCTIADTGIGIPPDRIQEIFEPFHQLDSSSTRRYGGTGLGLSLARKIIEAHGSTIEVQSQIGKGSQFSFLLATAKIPSEGDIR
ncbi:MAG TPA: ATP-binding protein, partial [Anaerolineaceae bacterium]|nr:ATP-binding protein [Anaerolineaceae bacterium]